MADALRAPGWTVEPDCRVARIQLRYAADAIVRLGNALNLDIPTEPNHETCGQAIAIAAIAPGEWLLTGCEAVIVPALERIRAEFAADLSMVTDLSAGRFCAVISGPDARHFVAAYSPLDICDSAFPTGAATRTLLGDIGMFIARLDDRPTYRIIVDRSHAAYVHFLLSHVQSGA